MKLSSLLILLLLSMRAQAEEPSIDILQSTEKGKSMIVLTWDNGKKDRLLVKDVDIKSRYVIEWFRDRLAEHK